MGKTWPLLAIPALLLSGVRPAWSGEEGDPSETSRVENRESPIDRRGGNWGVTLGAVWRPPPGEAGTGEVLGSLLPELRPRLHYFFSSHLAMEGEVHIGGDWQQNAFALANGTGLFDGSELGMGIRLLPLRTRWTPAMGGGAYLYAGGREIRIRNPNWTLSMQAGPTAFGWLYGGVDYLGPRGFAFTGQLGYKRLLTPQSIRIETTGRPDPSPESFRNTVYALGFHLSLSFGKTFAY